MSRFVQSSNKRQRWYLGLLIAHLPDTAFSPFPTVLRLCLNFFSLEGTLTLFRNCWPILIDVRIYVLSLWTVLKSDIVAVNCMRAS